MPRRPLALMMLVALLVACSSSADPESASPASSSSTTSTTTTLPEGVNPDLDVPVELQQEIIEDLLVSFQVRDRVSVDGNASDSELLETHAGGLLESIQSAIRGRNAAGRAVRYPDSSARSVSVLQVQSVEDDVAVVITCTVDDAVIFIESDGSVVNDLVSTNQIQITMEMLGDHWLATEQQTLESKDGVQPCDF